MASYPQPTENLGIFDSNVFNTQIDTTGLIKFPDGSQQTSAYTGAKSLAGSYLSTNMTIDANGKIIALSNGSGGGGGSQNLSTTLQIGNSAGIYNIDMNNNQIQNVSQITASSNLTLNPTSQTISNKNINMNNNQIQNVSQITATADLTLNPTTGKTISAKNMDMSGNQIQNVNTVGFVDTTSQTSAYTGAKLLAGSYTNTNMTIDANGKITALSNGSGGGGGSQTLAQTLQLGNSAGIYNIDMSGNQIQNVSQITATADLTLNPTGSIVCTGKTIDITNGVIHNCPLIDSQNNQNITIEGKGTGVVILKGNSANTQIQSTGLTTTPTLQVQDMTTTREVDIFTNSAASQLNPIVQANDTTIIGKGTTNTNGVIDIATNSATTSGVRITNNTALIGAGGVSATPSHYVNCDPTNNIIDISGNTRITGDLDVIGLPYNRGFMNTGISNITWYSTPTSGKSAGIPAQNTIYFHPFFIEKTTTFTKLGISTQAITTAGAKVLAGIYKASNGIPTTKIIETTITTISQAEMTYNSVSFTLQSGFYFGALAYTQAGTTMTSGLIAYTIPGNSFGGTSTYAKDGVQTPLYSYANGVVNSTTTPSLQNTITSVTTAQSASTWMVFFAL